MIRNNDNQDRAVSPVIGVMLMVAVTVLLAAIVGNFVIGMGNDAATRAPSISITAEQNTTHYIMTVEAGDNITTSETDIVVNGDTITPEVPFGDHLTPGARAKLNVTSPDYPDAAPGDEVRVVWTSPATGDQYTIFEGEVRDQ